MATSQPIQPLPSSLAKRYEAWLAGGFNQNRQLFSELVEKGQHPHSMVISCCDSRVDPALIFGAGSGELFVHRNIANLVPPKDSAGMGHGTAAALEYAVTALKVRHVIVMGHSGCGGIENGYHVCNRTKGHPLKKASSIHKWLRILEPAFARLPEQGGDEERIAMLERHAVAVSLENLTGFPFIAKATQSGQLSLHGLWYDIASGALLDYDGKVRRFTPVQG